MEKVLQNVNQKRLEIEDVINNLVKNINQLRLKNKNSWLGISIVDTESSGTILTIKQFDLYVQRLVTTRYVTGQDFVSVGSYRAFLEHHLANVVTDSNYKFLVIESEKI